MKTWLELAKSIYVPSQSIINVLADQGEIGEDEAFLLRAEMWKAAERAAKRLFREREG